MKNRNNYELRVYIELIRNDGVGITTIVDSETVNASIDDAGTIGDIKCAIDTLLDLYGLGDK